MIMTRACEKCMRIFQCYDGIKHSCEKCPEWHNCVIAEECQMPKINTIVTGLCPRCKEEYDQERTEAAAACKKESGQNIRNRQPVSLGLRKSDDKVEASGSDRPEAVLSSLRRHFLSWS